MLERRAIVIGLFASTLTHGSVIVLIALLLHARGASARLGEGGKAGAGDTTVDISVAGGTPSPPTPPETPPPDQQKQEEQAKVEPADIPATPPKTPPLPPTPPTPPGDANTTQTGKLTGPVQIGLALGDGAGGDTIEGQRALLPSAMVCKDPVAGRWEALKYNPLQGMWVHFILTVRRASASTVRGVILSRTWAGTMFDRLPPACTIGNVDMTVSMNATGSADASSARITFGASAYSVVSLACPGFNTGYAPDNFSGTIDAKRQEFQSVNNDGANDINAPYVFRRVGCLD